MRSQPPSKRRKLDARKFGQEELAFDPDARVDYLTGFHRRKQQRLKAAQETAARKAREQQVADRRALREQRKADLEAHVRAVGEAIAAAERGVIDSSDEERGAEDDEERAEGQEASEASVDDEQQPPKPVEEDEVEYVDEDKFTTVTIGPLDESSGEDDDRQTQAEDQQEFQETVKSQQQAPKKKQTAKHKAIDKIKKKKKAFRYESPAERKVQRSKQAKRNSEAASARRSSQSRKR